jgi:hypothetical protein
LEDIGLHGKIILWIFKKSVGGRGWIDLAQDRDKYTDVLNAMMNLLVP